MNCRATWEAEVRQKGNSVLEQDPGRHEPIQVCADDAKAVRQVLMHLPMTENARGGMLTKEVDVKKSTILFISFIIPSAKG